MNSLTKADRPQGLLGADATIDSEEHVEAALLELSWMAAHAASVNARVDAAIAQLRETADAEKTAELDGQAVKYGDRHLRLFDAIEAYIEEKMPELKTGDGTRTKHFRNGDVAWRKRVDTCELGCNLPGVRDAIDRLTQYKDRMRAVLDELIVFQRRAPKADVVLSDFTDVELKVSTAQLLKTVKAKKVTKPELAKLKAKICKGDDDLQVKPATYSPPANP